MRGAWKCLAEAISRCYRCSCRCSNNDSWDNGDDPGNWSAAKRRANPPGDGDSDDTVASAIQRWEASRLRGRRVNPPTPPVRRHRGSSEEEEEEEGGTMLELENEDSTGR